MSEAAAAKEGKRVTFRVVGGRSHERTVRNPSAKVVDKARHWARKDGLRGTFQMVSRHGGLLDPVSTTLADLEDDDTVVVSPNLTPASSS